MAAFGTQEPNTLLSLLPGRPRQRDMALGKVKVKFPRLTKKPSITETPWTDMASYETLPVLQDDVQATSASVPPLNSVEPTVASFSPGQQTGLSRSRNGTSILIHHKTPLLVATPPQITRALAYSHAFILPLNYLAGLISWTTGDLWESFLFVAAFWFLVLYGDHVIRWAGPLALVGGLVAGMSSRKYSPLSSTVWSEKQTGKGADSESRKSVDEIVDTLETFTKRCEVLLEPFMLLTDFLSTQLSPTSATTRPALTALFMRLLALTPIWFALTLPPLRLITTQRVVLVLGTIVFTWHSRSARVSRTILWRSRTIRYITSQITGLHFPGLPQNAPVPAWRKIDIKALIANGKASNDAGVRFTFALFENQRRWLGVGWTSGMLLHERQAWTDETNNTCPEPGDFRLPETDSGSTKWVWVAGSEWHVEGSPAVKDKSTKRDDNFGWTYFDWQWRDPKKSDTWGRYTRRRRWVRDAELVESGPETEDTSASGVEVVDGIDASSNDNLAKRKAWFGRNQSYRVPGREKSDSISVTGSGSTGDTVRSRDGPEEDVHTPHRYRNAEWDRSIGEGLAEGLS